MSTIMPEGESFRKAVKWISENLQDNPTQSMQKLINEAMLRFNLSPKESELLIDFYRKEKNSPL